MRKDVVKYDSPVINKRNSFNMFNAWSTDQKIEFLRDKLIEIYRSLEEDQFQYELKQKFGFTFTIETLPTARSKLTVE